MSTPTIEELTARVEELETQVAYLQEQADIANAVTTQGEAITGAIATQTSTVSDTIASTNIIGKDTGPFETGVDSTREFVVSPWPPESEEDEETEENP